MNRLHEQGIVDHCILPPIADAISLSLGLDLAGTPLDNGTSATYVLAYSGRHTIPLPASSNATPGVTAIVVQHPADGIEDGHEVVFQTEPPKHEYKCFRASLLAGTTSVPNGGAAEAACP
jgi:hypothetical protein